MKPDSMATPDKNPHLPAAAKHFPEIQPLSFPSMNIPTDLKKLTALFAKLGATEPESWASSQLDEGIPQLQRFLFLRQAWSKILDETNHAWIDSSIGAYKRYPTAPYSGIGAALVECEQKGVSRQALTDLARGIQAEMLFDICYLLEDARIEEPELENFQWGLFEVDEDDNPVGERIGALHESVLGTDPTGREMCPRES
jgi:hypothetical protein